MQEKLDELGAVVAHVIFNSSIITFASRIIFGLKPGHWVGTNDLAHGISPCLPASKGSGFQSPVSPLRSDWNHACLLILPFAVDYVIKYDFRQTRWMVISYVVQYFGGAGGMIGVAALAGRTWMISAVILFFITLILAFVMRAVTGL